MWMLMLSVLAVLTFWIITFMLVRPWPTARKIMLGLLPAVILLALGLWLMTFPAAMSGTYIYFAERIDGMGISPNLAKAIACIIVLPFIWGTALILRPSSSFSTRFLGAAIILAIFAGLFFWGYWREQEELARVQAEVQAETEANRAFQQAEAEAQRLESERALVQARQAEQIRLAEIEQERTRQQELATKAAFAEAEAQRLAMERQRLEMQEAERKRVDVARAAQEAEQTRSASALAAQQEENDEHLGHVYTLGGGSALLNLILGGMLATRLKK